MEKAGMAIDTPILRIAASPRTAGPARAGTTPGAARTVPSTTAGSASRPPEADDEKHIVKASSASAAALQTAASLTWLLQAGVLAVSAGMIADGTTATGILPAATLLLVLGTVRAILDRAGARMAFRAARQELERRRIAAIASMATGSPLDTDRMASGEAASIVAEQAEALVPWLSRYRPARLKATIIPPVLFLAILPLSWAAALVLLLAMPVIPLFMALIGWQAKAASEKQLAETGNMNALLLDRLRGLETIRTLDAVEATASRLRASADDLRNRTMAVLRIAFLSSAVLELFAALGVALVAVYVGFHLLGFLDFGAWGQRLSLVEGLFILLLAPAFFEPLRELSAVWHDRAAGEAAAAALAGTGTQTTRIHGKGDTGSVTKPQAPAAVTLDDVRFTYPGTETSHGPFCLDIRAGEKIALMGASGSGKSTLLALIAGLARADSGHIAIDGTPLEDGTADTIRSRTGWIGQKPHFFAASVVANVTMGRGGMTGVTAAHAIELAGLGKAHAARGHCPVGEGASGLSGGEAIRLAIARAAASDSTALILADEPTAHQDRQTAARITGSLLQLAQGRTMIVATHDPELAAQMDRVIRLDDSMEGELQ